MRRLLLYFSHLHSQPVPHCFSHHWIFPSCRWLCAVPSLLSCRCSASLSLHHCQRHPVHLPRLRCHHSAPPVIPLCCTDPSVSASGSTPPSLRIHHCPHSTVSTSVTLASSSTVALQTFGTTPSSALVSTSTISTPVSNLPWFHLELILLLLPFMLWSLLSLPWLLPGHCLNGVLFCLLLVLLQSPHPPSSDWTVWQSVE